MVHSAVLLEGDRSAYGTPFKGTEVNLNVLHAFGEAPSTLTWNTQSWHSVRVWHLFTLSTAWN